MKKLLLVVGLVVFLTPSLVLSNEKDLLGAHCIKETEIKSENYDGTWKNISESCGLTNIPPYNYLFTSELILKEGKVRLAGQISKLKGNKISFDGTLGYISGKIGKDKITLKISKLHKKVSSEAKKCKLEFIKNNEVQQESTAPTTKKSKDYCFCIDGRKKVYQLARYNGVTEYCSDNPFSYYDSKEISYGLFLRKNGKPIEGELEPVSVSLSFISKNKDLKKWLKENKKYKGVNKLIEVLDINEDTAKFLIKNNFVSSKSNSKYDMILSLIDLEKIEGLDKNQSKNIIIKAKNFIKLKEEEVQEELIALEKSLGHKPSYYDIVCNVQATLSDARLRRSSSCVQDMIWAVLEANKNNNQEEPSEEQKQQALAQQNATGQANWKTTSGGIGYWDYGNGFGWAPPNAIRDRIIQGFSISQRTKNMLKTGSKGRTIFIPK